MEPALRDRCGFLHIPKTAGNSVRAALAARFPAEQTSRYIYDDALFGTFEEFDTLAPVLRASVLLPTDDIAEGPARLVAGHLSLRGMQRLLPPGDVFTVLREPRARLLSHQLYWALRPDNGAFGKYEVMRLSFDGLRPFLERAEAAHQADNLICRMLAAGRVAIPRDRAMTPSERDAAAAAAIETIETFGLTTYVGSPTMWSDVASFVGVPLEPVNANVTNSDDHPIPFAGAQLDVATLELLEERTTADAQVFRHVVSSRGGCGATEVTRLADYHFVAQVERYARVATKSERARPEAASIEPTATNVASARRSWWQRLRS